MCRSPLSNTAKNSCVSAILASISSSSLRGASTAGSMLFKEVSVITSRASAMLTCWRYSRPAPTRTSRFPLVHRHAGGDGRGPLQPVASGYRHVPERQSGPDACVNAQSANGRNNHVGARFTELETRRGEVAQNGCKQTRAFRVDPTPGDRKRHRFSGPWIRTGGIRGGITPVVAGRSGRSDLAGSHDHQRRRARSHAGYAHDPARHAARASRPHRHEEGLRSRPMRSVHGAGGGPPDQLLPDAGSSARRRTR